MNNIPNIANIIASYSSRNKFLQDSTADPGASILKMEREKQYAGKHTGRMTRPEKIAALQEKVVNRLLERSIDKHNHPKTPHLRIVK